MHELELEKDEDAPMSMAANSEVRHPERFCNSINPRCVQSKQLVCGINSTLDKLENGQNENCRVYGVQDKKC
jgi:prolactin regulatory element-binding protein